MTMNDAPDCSVLLGKVLFDENELPIPIRFHELAMEDGTGELKVTTLFPILVQGPGRLVLVTYASNGKTIEHSWSKVLRVVGHEMTMAREMTMDHEAPPMTFVTTFRHGTGCRRETKSLGVVGPRPVLKEKKMSGLVWKGRDI